VGTTTVTFTATDDCGNESVGSMTVTVQGPQDIKENAKECLLENITLGCSGISSMTVSYAGGAGANLTLDKKGKSKDTITDNGDGTYTITPDKDKLGASTKIYVNGVEQANFHTSCSKDIEVGDADGNFTITALVKIPGDISKAEPKRIAKAIKEIDQSLDSKYWIDATHLYCKHGHRVFSEERHAVKELMHLLKGIPANAKCKGIASMTLEYSGGAGADITVDKGTVADNGDGTYTITPEDGKEKLSANTKIYVDGVFNTEIHTSC